jgi:hypothetical protein
MEIVFVFSVLLIGALGIVTLDEKRRKFENEE